MWGRCRKFGILIATFYLFLLRKNGPVMGFLLFWPIYDIVSVGTEIHLGYVIITMIGVTH